MAGPEWTRLGHGTQDVKEFRPPNDRADSDIQITRLAVAGAVATIWGLRRGTESWRRRVCKK